MNARFDASANVTLAGMFFIWSLDAIISKLNISVFGVVILFVKTEI